jgi:L-alanine-DL-glutamate epimerase-like enolase superfamily enzyme
VDANGAFKPEEALEKLERLSKYELHSIEQPIAAGQFKFLKKLCAQTPIPIALDEELIGVLNVADKAAILDEIQPQYIVLKPSLLGGFTAAEEWITLAKARNIGWWITSALESNIGLNAIAQWTATLNTSMPQGLGTGGLFTNNIESPLVAEVGVLQYNNKLSWVTKHIK